ncbi:MAG: DUF4384 domain-containing protein [Bacteroidales bacterium]|nr:DUF4384 domain-containing protein [Bacteroidales bacterium]
MRLIMRLSLLAFLIAFVTFVVSAQQTRTVDAAYTYHAAPSQSVDEAKMIALERAQIQAIANEFGTYVDQTESITYSADKLNFLSIGGSEVRGEWIETTKEPKYEITYDQGLLVVSVTTRGVIRESAYTPIDLQVNVLRNLPDKKMVSDQFRNLDYMYMHFSSPVDGWLTVYMLDVGSQNVYRLLPYRRQKDEAFSVGADTDYYLFAPEKVPQEVSSIVDAYRLTASGDQTEMGQLYVIFSPNHFSRASDAQSDEKDVTELDFPRQLTYRDFQKWLSRNRKRDPQMQLRVHPIFVMP